MNNKFFEYIIVGISTINFMKIRLYLPRFMDENNICAQNLNAKELLKRSIYTNFKIETKNYYPPIEEIKNNKIIKTHQLKKGKLWYLHNAILYLRKNEIIFYPDFNISDYIGIRLRSFFRIKTVLITSLELLFGEEKDRKFMRIYQDIMFSLKSFNF